MNALKIKILLHYFVAPGDYRAETRLAHPDHATPDNVDNSIRELVKYGLLKSRYADIAWSIDQSHHTEPEGPFFTITDKGVAMVDHLMAVEIPVCKWVRPEEADNASLPN